MFFEDGMTNRVGWLGWGFSVTTGQLAKSWMGLVGGETVVDGKDDEWIVEVSDFSKSQTVFGILECWKTFLRVSGKGVCID